MKITPMISGSRPAPGTEKESQDKNTAQTSTSGVTPASAEDITQAGLQSAQQALNEDSQGDIDYDNVARMQATLATGEPAIDTDQLAADMFRFFQK
ncbi:MULTISPECIES: flagellar biosynthesis anti-sigma factor FlgM [Enterobacterales]|uniref:flagellar biosynthesis anti-sigma factor FlgM n=1 Tax=Enterobacterales TaxID=91347 RepID=UPI002EDAB0B7